MLLHTLSVTPGNSATICCDLCILSFIGLMFQHESSISSVCSCANASITKLLSIWPTTACQLLCTQIQGRRNGSQTDTHRIMKGYKGLSLTLWDEYKMSIFSLHYQKIKICLHTLWTAQTLVIAASGCRILKLKCTKFNFDLGLFRQPPLVELLLQGFKWSTSKRKRGERKKGEQRGEEGRGSTFSHQSSSLHPMLLAERVRPSGKVLQFSVTNELSLENYLSYMSTKFGENLWKIVPSSVDEREIFITAEFGRRAMVCMQTE